MVWLQVQLIWKERFLMFIEKESILCAQKEMESIKETRQMKTNKRNTQKESKACFENLFYFGSYISYLYPGSYAI